MAETEETGEKRIVDQLHPPVQHRFGPGNQASKGVRHGKGMSIISELKRLLRQHMVNKDGSVSSTTYRQALAKSLVAHFLKGNPAAIKEIMHRIDGPIPTEITGKGGGPIETKDVTLEELKKLDPRELASLHEDALAESEGAQPK